MSNRQSLEPLGMQAELVRLRADVAAVHRSGEPACRRSVRAWPRIPRVGDDPLWYLRVRAGRTRVPGRRVHEGCGEDKHGKLQADAARSSGSDLNPRLLSGNEQDDNPSSKLARQVAGSGFAIESGLTAFR